MLHSKKAKMIFFGLLFIFAGSAYALQSRVTWIPQRLAPESVAPGGTASYTVVLKHTGILPIPATSQLRVVAEGDIAPFVTLTQPKFPPVFKYGNQVNVKILVTVPTSTPLSAKEGDLILKRVLPNGKEMEVWRADALPVELTFSSIPLPPDPGEAGKADLLGIDTDGNGIRDDIDRYIVFTYPNSAKSRAALSQAASAYQVFLRDSNDREKTIDNAHADKSSDCMAYVFNGAAGSSLEGKKLFSAYLNTPDRSRTYVRADTYLGGQVFGGGLLSDLINRRRAACNFDPDTLPN